MDDTELEKLLTDLESDRTERKASVSDRGKIQEAHKPIFTLKLADGAIGAHQKAVQSVYQDFQKLAQKINC